MFLNIDFIVMLLYKEYFTGSFSSNHLKFLTEEIYQYLNLNIVLKHDRIGKDYDIIFKSFYPLMMKVDSIPVIYGIFFYSSSNIVS